MQTAVFRSITFSLLTALATASCQPSRGGGDRVEVSVIGSGRMSGEPNAAPMPAAGRVLRDAVAQGDFLEGSDASGRQIWNTRRRFGCRS